MTARRRSCASDRERQQVVDEFQSYDYRVATDGPGETVLVRRDHGSLGWHIVVFLLLGWWTIGLANVCYALYRRVVSTERVRVVVES